MKIAVVTNDGKTVGQHFGRMRFYKVITVEDGKVIDEELREKFLRHGTQDHVHHHEHDHDHHGHGTHEHDQRHHNAMIEAIRDCDVFIGGMMGRGAFASLENAGLKVVLTKEKEIDAAVRLYLDGKLENLADSLTH